MGHEVWRLMQPRGDVANVKLPKGLIRRVLVFAKPYRFRLIVLMAIIVGMSGLAVLNPLLIKMIIDDALPNRDMALLTRLSLAMVGVAALTGLVAVGMRYLTSSIGEGIIYDLRVALFQHVQRLPIAFFTRTQTGALMSRLNTDVIGAQRAVTETTSSTLSIAAELLVTAGTMFALEPRLTLASFIVLPLFVLPTKKVGKVLQGLVQQRMERDATMNNQMTERFHVGGALLVKLFGNYATESDVFAKKAGDVRDMGVKTAMYGRLLYMSFTVAAAIGTALVYWLGGRMVIQGTLEIGTIVAFSLYLTRLFGPITGLSSIPIDIKTALVSFNRVFEVLDFPSSIRERLGAVDLVDPKGEVEFDDVWFRYPSGPSVSIASLEEGRPDTGAPEDEEAWVLKGVSFRIEPGQMVALVGPSGAGKSTISSLVPRLYDATEGEVRMDGVDVKDLTLQSLMDAVGTVPQDVHLFHDTIRANLAYAKPDATDEEIIEATKAAQIYELIQSLPDGLDTMVGERGYRLSGGEKQRLAIARLLLKDPAVVILDEATAHLDSESELLIQRALARVLQGRSSLVIAHRLSTITSADQILVVDEGRIVERGTHLQLLRGGGLYEDLYRTQFEGAQAQLEAVADDVDKPMPQAVDL
ncbi:MAG TPA: ABC transporter ATP-binding protein [Actinomycetota bacterium]|nr:ABC transporter ATP-binding protein [Actinomycetota bacterium]